MIYSESPPSADLAEYIRCFWELRYKSAHDTATSEPVLPDGCPEMVFNLSDHFLRVDNDRIERQPRVLLAGQLTQRILIRPSGNVDLFGVRLQPAGAASVLGIPVDEVTDQIVDLADMERNVRSIEDRIADAPSFRERTGLVESFVRCRLRETIASDHAATIATNMICRFRGSEPVSRIHRRLDISERQFERRFKRTVGIGPKMFSRIVRFQSVLRAVQTGTSYNLLDAALGSGYYDQSHLIRDFRKFSGLTPAAYFDRVHGISDVFTGAA